MKSVESRLGKVVLARLYEDEDLLESITQQAKRSGIKTGFFILIGTLKRAKLGFDREGQYQPIAVAGPLEITSCVGNVSIKDGEAFTHAHITVSNDKGEAFGGHTLPGCIVAETGELVLIEAEGIKLQRRLDEKTKLYLWDFGKPSAKRSTS